MTETALGTLFTFRKEHFTKKLLRNTFCNRTKGVNMTLIFVVVLYLQEEQEEEAGESPEED